MFVSSFLITLIVKRFNKFVGDKVSMIVCISKCLQIWCLQRKIFVMGHKENFYDGLQGKFSCGS